MRKLSIVIPVYNERNTIAQIINKVERTQINNFEKEIIVVDDGSSDGTKEVLKDFESKHVIIEQPKNLAKERRFGPGFPRLAAILYWFRTPTLNTTLMTTRFC